VLDSDSGDKAIDDVNGYRWAEWSPIGPACPEFRAFPRHNSLSQR